MSKLKARKLSQVQSYIAGFIFSIILTLIPYYIVVNEKLSGDSLLFGVMGYAVIQFVVQVVFFLHLGHEKNPRWKLISIVFMVAVMLFIAIGTLWIMKNLDYHILDRSPKEVENTLLESQNYKPNNY